MVVIVLFTLFESQLFPHSIFLEDQYNPATYYQDGFEINIETGTRFGLPELRTYTIHSKIESYGISVISFGNDIYRENVVCANLSFRIVQKLTAGFGITMLNYWVKDYCSRLRYSMTAGFCFQEKGVTLDGWIAHLNTPHFNGLDEIPVVYSLKLRYLTKPAVSLIFSVRGMDSELPFYNFGLTYAPSQGILFGLGANTDPVFLEYVVQINAGTIHLDYTGKTHQYLGLSHFFGLRYTP